MIQIKAINPKTGAVYYQHSLGTCMLIHPANNIHESVRGNDITKALKKGFVASTLEFNTEAEFEAFLKQTSEIIE